ncbi:hypothetical protein D3C80_1437260 [compost metagenome]
MQINLLEDLSRAEVASLAKTVHSTNAGMIESRIAIDHRKRTLDRAIVLCLFQTQAAPWLVESVCFVWPILHLLAFLSVLTRSLMFLMPLTLLV